MQCQYLLTPAAQTFTARGGNGSLSVLAASGCAWTAVSNAPWLTLTSAASGAGPGRVNYSVPAHTGAQQRSAIISVGGSVGSQSFTVTQAGTSASDCTVTPLNPGQTINGALAPGDCQSPLRLRDGARPLADRYSFNGAAGQAIVITLASAAFDTYLYLLDANGAALAQNDDSGAGGSRIPAGDGAFILPASGAFLIEVTAFASGGVGNYALNLSTPAGGCTFALNSSGQLFPTGGGAGAVSVNTQANCAWRAASNNNWLTLSGAGNGSGPGAVNFAVAANSGLARTGALTVAGLTFTVTQAGANGAGCPTISGLAPNSGPPGATITISGAHFTGVTAVSFAHNVAASFSVSNDTQLRAKVPNGAANGPVTISKPGCPDAQTAGFTVNRPVASVSAASFSAAALAPEAIVAAFGESLATSVATADTLPLPTTLVGSAVRVRDSNGVERLAPLFFVAPAQINYLIPPGTAPGAATISVSSGNGVLSLGNVSIAPVAPGLFSANASGQGVAAAVALRVKADGTQSYELVARFDATLNRFVSAPLDLGPAGEQVFLLLFGTGLRGRSALTATTALLGGVSAEVSFVGAVSGLVGLDQVNVTVPRNLAGRGEVDIVLMVDGKAANTVRVNIK
jgi:uncharacterized protein (TIGR03437 family)